MAKEIRVNRSAARTSVSKTEDAGSSPALPASSPIALDLFCKAGGVSMGLHRAGFRVEGVDISPQPRYPFKFHQADALTFPLEGYDFIWASPPCQAYSALKTMTNRREHPELVHIMRERLEESGTPWVIENVFGAPLRSPLMLCGSHFGLMASNGYALRRHRYFESSFMLMNGHPCVHAEKTVGIYGSKARDIAKEKRHYSQDKATRGEPDGVVLPKEVGFEAMGIDWMNQAELSEAIPPAYSEFIGRQFLANFPRSSLLSRHRAESIKERATRECLEKCGVGVSEETDTV